MTAAEALRVGDRVRTICETWGEDLVPVGAVGTVAQPPPLLAVAFDHDPAGDGTGVWAINPYQVTLLAESPTEQEALRSRYRPMIRMLLALNDFHSPPEKRT